MTPVEETLSFLDGAVRDGKVRYVGLSNCAGWQLQLMVSTARQMSVQVPVTLQQYSLLSRESEWEVVPAALHNGIALLPWSPWRARSSPASTSAAGRVDLPPRD
jgi:aryl-alcohol dehydrogenase-like predicted oxidoreductase